MRIQRISENLTLIIGEEPLVKKEETYTPIDRATWPKVGDSYYSITGSGCKGLTVAGHRFKDDDIDLARQHHGNFFRTKDEAEMALSRIKKIFETNATGYAAEWAEASKVRAAIKALRAMIHA